MPKTKDAFALRDLYNALFCVSNCEFIPSYMKRPSVEELAQLSYLNSADCRIEEILLSYLDNKRTEYTEGTFPELNRIKKDLALCKARILILREKKDKVSEHIVLLQRYEREIFSHILSSGFSDDLKNRGERVKMLFSKYEWILRLLISYEDILSRDYLDEDKKFQAECRKEFGKRLRQARIDKKISIETMAKTIGMTRTGYGYYELGQRDLPTPTIYRLAEILDVSTDWLFGLKD